ncbi:MAG: hypothetical protein FJ315_07110 [SAR202 cluster bacterium]|nr:hypothetical protein [SAR202 cluster bacterium]
MTWVVFSIHRRHPTIPWQHQGTDRLLGFDLRTEWDGSFQLILSPQPHPGNWLKTSPDTYQLGIRQFFGVYAWYMAPT